MTKLYFHGGEDINERDAQPINEQAFADVGGHPGVLIFPWTGWFTTLPRNKYRSVMKKYFNALGAENVGFMELNDSQKQYRAKIEKADFIYLPGGKVTYLVDRIEKRGITSLLKGHTGVIMGNSAGSLALCNKFAVIKGQGDRPKSALNSGLGLADFPVSVHYNSPRSVYYSGQDPDAELRGLSERHSTTIYAIPEKCALVYEEGKKRSIGDVYVFSEGRKRKM